MNFRKMTTQRLDDGRVLLVGIIKVNDNWVMVGRMSGCTNHYEEGYHYLETHEDMIKYCMDLFKIKDCVLGIPEEEY